jgi:hypothetical protein
VVLQVVMVMMVMVVVDRVMHHVMVVVVIVMVDRRSGQRRRCGEADNQSSGDQQILKHSLSPWFERPRIWSGGACVPKGE